jgi:glycolate oxidase FAD binding subunit
VSDQDLVGWPAPPAAGPLGDGLCATRRLRPETAAELCQGVLDTVRDGLAVYPQGGCTALDYGNPPGRPGAVIDTRSLSRVIDYPHADMTITVEAGTTAGALRAILAEQRQRLLVDVPQADRATIGGVYATATCGPRRFGAGRPRDQIIGVSFVTAEGVEVKGGGRVVKNVAGYDFPKLLTGSMGTLGIITQMTLKVRPIPEASAIVWVPLERLETATDVLEKLNTSDARPIAIELLSDKATAAVIANQDLPAGAWVLAIGLEDSAASVRWQVSRLMIELGRADLTVLENETSALLWSGLTEFQAAKSGPIGCTVALPRSRVVPFLAHVDAARWAVQAHAGNGVVRLLGLGDWTREMAWGEMEQLRLLATEQGGSLVVSRCPAPWKARICVWGPRRPDWVLAKKVKQALDPAGVLNPGRFVGGI